MIKFLQQKDELSITINNACNTLYNQIQKLNIDELQFEPFFKNYFIKCHLQRPIFSLKTSAFLLYNAIISTNKNYKDVVIMDYGAGLGTLYILAKMIGVKKIIYNDLLPEFALPAIEVDKVFGYIMDEYINGDTLDTCNQLKIKNIICDVIVSRNVIEHIYNLELYFKIINKYQPKAILYNSTTANWNNPAAHIQHIYLHKKAKPFMLEQKKNFILKNYNSISDSDASMLSKKLLQYGGDDFINAIDAFIKNKTIPVSKNEYTNVCDENGTWCEHLIKYKKYKQFAPQYNVTILPGFWDVDYLNSFKKIIGKAMNGITNMLGRYGNYTTSFIYVICKPK